MPNSRTRLTTLVIFFAFISATSGYLLSKASLVGRTGINLFYREYRFLRTGWQAALLIFFVFCILLVVHYWVQNGRLRSNRKIYHLLLMGIGFAGLFLTYSDFRNTLSHKLLGERFHLGAYLFWIGWLAIGAVYILSPPTAKNEA